MFYREGEVVENPLLPRCKVDICLPTRPLVELAKHSPHALEPLHHLLTWNPSSAPFLSRSIFFSSLFLKALCDWSKNMGWSTNHSQPLLLVLGEGVRHIFFLLSSDMCPVSEVRCGGVCPSQALLGYLGHCFRVWFVPSEGKTVNEGSLLDHSPTNLYQIRPVAYQSQSVWQQTSDAMVYHRLITKRSQTDPRPVADCSKVVSRLGGADCPGLLRTSRRVAGDKSLVIQRAVSDL